MGKSLSLESHEGCRTQHFSAAHLARGLPRPLASRPRSTPQSVSASCPALAGRAMAQPNSRMSCVLHPTSVVRNDPRKGLPQRGKRERVDAHRSWSSPHNDTGMPPAQLLPLRPMLLPQRALAAAKPALSHGALHGVIQNGPARDRTMPCAQRASRSSSPRTAARGPTAGC